MSNKIQLKRGSKNILPTLDIGEPAFCTDTKELYIGASDGNVKIPNEAEVDAKDKAIDDKLSILSALQNGFKIYTSLADLGLQGGLETMTAIGTAMQNKSMLVMTANVNNNAIEYPEANKYGLLKVVKTEATRVKFEYTISTGIKKSSIYYVGWHNGTDFLGWSQLATTDKIDISLLNGWKSSNADNTKITLYKTGNIVTINEKIHSVACSANTAIFDIPPNFRPFKGKRFDFNKYTTYTNGTLEMFYIDFKFENFNAFTGTYEINVNASWSVG